MRRKFNGFRYGISTTLPRAQNAPMIGKRNAKVHPRFNDDACDVLLNNLRAINLHLKSQSKNHNLLHFNNVFIVCYFNKLYMEFTFLSLSWLAVFTFVCLFMSREEGALRFNGWNVFVPRLPFFFLQSWWIQHLLHKCSHHYSLRTELITALIRSLAATTAITHKFLSALASLGNSTVKMKIMILRYLIWFLWFQQNVKRKQRGEDRQGEINELHSTLNNDKV